MRPTGICSTPGCPDEAKTNGKCATHLAETRKNTDRRRGGGRARGYDQRWARTRGAYLYRHSTCEEPGCPRRATDVHHKDGRGPTGPDGHKWANLEALCHSHHSQRTAREQPAGFNS